MTVQRRCLALMTDAYGGRGGIAQYNRDLTAAMALVPSVDAIDILPRVVSDLVVEVPDKVRQHPARLGRIGYVIAAWRLALRLRPQIIFCGHLYMVPLGLVLARVFRARLIVQAHGIEAWSRPPKLQRLAMEHADIVLAVSRDTRARVLDWAKIAPERVRVASNTVADDFVPGDVAAARLGLGLAQEFVILTVGRMSADERYKGHDRVIPLLKSLAESGLAPVYLIAGDGDDQGRLQTLACRHDVDDKVRFLGHVPRDELPDLYRAAHLFVLPSTGEGFGIVLLEAMACGTPAIALAQGGAIDALCDGELGTALDEEHLPRGLLTACCDSLSGRLIKGEPLARRVRERFGRHIFERRVRDILASLEAA